MRCNAHEVHAHEVYAREMHAHEVHTHEMHACEVHAHEVHAHEVYAHEVYAYEVHASWQRRPKDKIQGLLSLTTSGLQHLKGVLVTYRMLGACRAYQGPFCGG